MELTTNQKPFEAVYCIDENEWNGKFHQPRLKILSNEHLKQ
jgi:single-stranded-DNA-specific exonuclease